MVDHLSVGTTSMKTKHLYHTLVIGIISFVLHACDKKNGVAVHKPEDITVTTHVIPEGAGKISPESLTCKAGELVTLTAEALGDYDFLYWDGDKRSSTLTFRPYKDETWAAHFSIPYTKRPIIDFHKPSVMLKDLYYGVDLSMGGWAHWFVTVDYNKDGYGDIVEIPLNDAVPSRGKIRFYLGDKYGSFTPDSLNTDRFTGQIWPRKQLLGDYNSDGFPDICLLSHGWDYDPYPGDYPVILLSDGKGSFTSIEMTDQIGYYHGGSSGDFDNDGDLDIILSDANHENSAMLINDGSGGFRVDKTVLPYPEWGAGTYCLEMYDINQDGFLDIICNAKRKFDCEDGQIRECEYVLWGNGESFSMDRCSPLPLPAEGFDCTDDYEFRDLDGDGKEEIILAHSGDGSMGNNNRGWNIQIVSCIENSLVDVTEQYMNQSVASEKNAKWALWIDFETIDGELYLIGRQDCNGVMLLKFHNGKFFRP